MKTSIIILTYNSEKYMKKLIESILEFNKAEEFEIIIVDNNSQDETVEKLRSSHFANRSNMKVFETGANLGFAKGINYGAERAKGEYLLFVNPDATWDTGSAKNFIEVFDQFPKAGVIGGKMMSPAGNAEKSVGKFYGFWTSVATALGLDEELGLRSSPAKTSQVDSVSGGFMMVKKSVFEKLHGFDETYFMYIEDSDLCFRARKHGIFTYFTPNVGIVHQGQGSSNKAFAFKNIIKGILYFQRKHVNYLSYIVVKMLFLFKAGILVLIGKILNNKTLTDNYIGLFK